MLCCAHATPSQRRRCALQALAVALRAEGLLLRESYCDYDGAIKAHKEALGVLEHLTDQRAKMEAIIHLGE